MGVRVDQNLERMRAVLASRATRARPQLALDADDEIDAMNVSLTERCYDLLAREQPVASDLRLIVSVVRITARARAHRRPGAAGREAGPRPRLCSVSRRGSSTSSPSMADLAWTTTAWPCAASSASRPSWPRRSRPGPPEVSHLTDRLVGEVHRLQGDEAVPVAVKAMIAGHALARIDDHAAVLGARLRYLFTGDPDHLAAEVR